MKLSASQFKLVEGCKTTKETWQKLNTTFEESADMKAENLILRNYHGDFRTTTRAVATQTNLTIPRLLREEE